MDGVRYPERSGGSSRRFCHALSRTGRAVAERPPGDRGHDGRGRSLGRWKRHPRNAGHARRHGREAVRAAPPSRPPPPAAAAGRGVRPQRHRARPGHRRSALREELVALGADREPHRRVHHHRPPPPGGVYARNAIVLDPATGEVLYEKNSSRSVPIASLTKLMTALVFLEQKPDLTREVEVTPGEIAGAGHTQLRRGERVPLGELLHMSLMCSDNCATRVIALESGLSPADFIARMNTKAVELGLTGARFVEFTGLDEHNVATASDVARLLHAAANEPLIAQITTTRSYPFRTERRGHATNNTARLLHAAANEPLIAQITTTR